MVSGHLPPGHRDGLGMPDEGPAVFPPAGGVGRSRWSVTFDLGRTEPPLPRLGLPRAVRAGLDEVIAARRDIRRFRPDPVPDDLLTAVLRPGIPHRRSVTPSRGGSSS